MVCRIGCKDIEPEWFEEGQNIRVADAFVVDIMLNANGQTYDTLRRYARRSTSMGSVNTVI